MVTLAVRYLSGSRMTIFGSDYPFFVSYVFSIATFSIGYNSDIFGVEHNLVSTAITSFLLDIICPQ